MLCSMNDLKGYIIVATDGEIGNVEEFYFDDEQWTVRYIVANTGSWLSGRQVLIPPLDVMRMNRENRKIHLQLTKALVEKYPDIDTQKPVSRQMEAADKDYYDYPFYWGGPFPGEAGENAAPGAPQATRATGSDGPALPDDEHLRSLDEVTTYRIEATDGEIGHVADFIMDDATWVIHYLAVDTHTWMPGKKVLVAPQWISKVDWIQGKVHINLSREGITRCAEYDGSTLISREYETRLHQHYRQNEYWLN